MTFPDPSPTTLELDGRYRLIRPLAKVMGGGHVFAAEHRFTLRRCAVKLLDHTSPDNIRKRMWREMNALARVQGPGVVDFRDAGESEGRPYLVLEFLEGRTLAGLLAAKGKLGMEQAVKVSVDIADALARCHGRGVVHRDVKPSNVFVTTNESVQLLDFGIAKVIDPDQTMEKLTLENTLLGTLEYMAPEALLSSPDVDHRVDQYALGVTLYECLTGTLPYEGSNPPMILKQIMKAKAPPMDALRAVVPEALVNIIGRALSLRSEERFADIAEMRAALSRVVPSSPARSMFETHVDQPRPERDAPTSAEAPQARLGQGRTRRRHPRAPYVTLARIRRADGSDVDGRLEEISESGFQFVGEQRIPLGETVTIRFGLPANGRIVEASAISRWDRATRGLAAAGFEFTSLPADALVELRKYVSIMCAD